MWFDLLMALQSAFINDAEMEGIPVMVGAKTPVPDYECVVLLRGTFDPKNNNPSSREDQQIFIETWVYDEDSDHPEKGYQKLDQLEKKVIRIANEFGKGDRRFAGKKIRTVIGQTQPDGDVFRPSLGSRTTVSIQWQ
jgi:hypothetical protein